MCRSNPYQAQKCKNIKLIKMSGFEGIGKILIITGIIILVVGLLLSFGARIPLLGKLPGDIIIHRGSSIFYFPVLTFIIISAILTIIINVIFRLLGK